MAETVAQAEEALKLAQDEFTQADNRCRDASRDRTKALNDLNAAQKKFDEAVGEVRKNSPRDSDWHHGIGER